MFLEIFKVNKPILAMLHLKGVTHAERLDHVLREADIYVRNGVDAMIVEDYFGDALDVELALKLLRKQRPSYTLGANVLNNFPLTYRLAQEYGLPFIQVDSVCGHLPPDEEQKYFGMIDHYRSQASIAVIGGVRFKCQPILSGRSFEEDLKLGMQHCDAIAVTGEGTGLDTDIEKIKAFRAVLGDFPLVVAAGVNQSSMPEKLSICDAAIVGSTFKDTRKATGDVYDQHVKSFMDEVKRLFRA